MMEDFEARLYNEKIELQKKCYQLQHFIDDDSFYTIPVEQQHLLTSQLGVMNAYLAILHARIAFLGEYE